MKSNVRYPSSWKKDDLAYFSRSELIEEVRRLRALQVPKDRVVYVKESVGSPNTDPNAIIDRICKMFAVTREDIFYKGKSLYKHMPARATLAVLLYLLPKASGDYRSYPEVAKILQKQDHTTVMNLIKYFYKMASLPRDLKNDQS